MPATIKPGVYTIVHTVKVLCRFVTKHSGTIIAVLSTVLSGPEMVTLNTFISDLNALCTIFNNHYPDIHA